MGVSSAFASSTKSRFVEFVGDGLSRRRSINLEVLRENAVRVRGEDEEDVRR